MNSARLPDEHVYLSGKCPLMSKTIVSSIMDYVAEAPNEMSIFLRRSHCHEHKEESIQAQKRKVITHAAQQEDLSRVAHGSYGCIACFPKFLEITSATFPRVGPRNPS